jgi:L-threonylcarbamoyladenylate synthase
MTIVSIQAVLTSAGLEGVHRVIDRGGVLAIPTETYYALGVSPFSPAAIDRLTRLKDRPNAKPILVLLAAPSDLKPLAAEVPPVATVLIERFWPGPLTIVLPARPSLPSSLTAGSGTIGVRQPDHLLLLKLLGSVGPLTGTSANRSGDPPGQSAQTVAATLGDEIDLIVDGGTTPGGLPSTLVSVIEPARVLREGPITREAITAALADAGLRLA